jgi:alkaline phosphatase
MTTKAISLLQGNPKGFVLQVEGASIDKRDHSADACGQIGELLGMDDALGVAQEFQRTHPDTLVLVTADHSHTSQIIPVTQVPRGAYTTLQTVDGAPIRIAYATVPVFGSGPRAADIVGTIDQTELFPVLTNTQTGDGPATATPVGGDVGGSVPATLALTVGAPAAFAPFTPGVGKDYTASMTAIVTSSAADAALWIADPSATNTGRLVNGTFALAQPLQVRARSGAFAAVGGSAVPTGLLNYTGPVANDAVPIEFKQTIGANEPLRTGAYAKTLTLTLSTTAP